MKQKQNGCLNSFLSGGVEGAWEKEYGMRIENLNKRIHTNKGFADTGVLLTLMITLTVAGKTESDLMSFIGFKVTPSGIRTWIWQQDKDCGLGWLV